MAYASRSGRARTNARDPRAHAICDRCGFRYNHQDLSWQMDWAGAKLTNLRILVCRSCTDMPQEQNRAIVITADPIPIVNARPEFFGQDEGPIGKQYSPTGYPNQLLFLVQLSNIGALPYLPKSPPSGGGAYWNDGNVLSVTAGGLYPLPTVLSLIAGTYWNNGGVVSVTPGAGTVIPLSMPLYKNLLWNNGGVICIS